MKKDGAVSKALQCLRETARAIVQTNTVTLSAALSVFEKASHWATSLQLVHEMAHDVVAADEITYNASVSACEASGPWLRALALLGEMPRQSVSLGGICLGTVVGALQKAACWRGDIELFRDAAMVYVGGAGSRSHVSDGQTYALDILLEAPGLVALAKPVGISTEHVLDGLCSRLLCARRDAAVTRLSRLDTWTSDVGRLGGDAWERAGWCGAAHVGTVCRAIGVQSVPMPLCWPALRWHSRSQQQLGHNAHGRLAAACHPRLV